MRDLGCRSSNLGMPNDKACNGCKLFRRADTEKEIVVLVWLYCCSLFAHITKVEDN